MLTGKQKNITNIEKFLISHILISRPFAPNHAQTGILLPCQELNIQIVTIVHIHINTQGRILWCKTDQTDRLKDGRTNGRTTKETPTCLKSNEATKKVHKENGT